MKLSIKFITPILVILVVMSLFYVALNIRRAGTNVQPPNPEVKENNNNSRQRDLSPREARIKAYLANPQDAITFKIGKRTFSVVDYLHSEYSNVPNHSSFPYVRGGIIVFEGKEIIWESSEFISDVSQLRFQDVNEDGIGEILFEDFGSGNRPSCAFYMYQWRDEMFHLISPYEELTTSKGTYRGTTADSCGPSVRDGFLKDLDDDGTDELIQVRDDTIGGDIGNWQYKSTKQIYKFNGERYELWKEEPATLYDPKKFEPTPDE